MSLDNRGAISEANGARVMRDFLAYFGAFHVGAFVEKCFVAAGWPDTTIMPAVASAAIAVACGVAVGTMIAAPSPDTAAKA